VRLFDAGYTCKSGLSPRRTGFSHPTGRRDPELLLDHPDGDLRSYAYLVAAPAPMVDASAQTLDAAGVPEQQVSADRISGY
jgi:hypothetical protein